MQRVLSPVFRHDSKECSKPSCRQREWTIQCRQSINGSRVRVCEEQSGDKVSENIKLSLKVTHDEWKSSKSGSAVSRVDQCNQKSHGGTCQSDIKLKKTTEKKRREKESVRRAEIQSRWPHGEPDAFKRVFFAFDHHALIQNRRLLIANVHKLSGGREHSFQVPFNVSTCTCT